MTLRHVRIILIALIALEVALLLFGPQTRDHLPAIESALAARSKPDWWDDAALGIRYAAWINSGLLTLLLLTSTGWTRPLGESQASSLKPQASSPRWFWPLAILAVIACLALRLPLASKSLWWDEAWVIQQVSHGKWKPDSKQPDKVKFMAHDWKRCAFYYQKPTNHVPMSLAQKASITAWQKLTGAKREEFSDLAARVPALLASCVAVLLLACLLKEWGRPGVGIVAAFLLAVHPWHIRHGVDARAYALVVPLCIGGMFATTRILQTGGAKVLPWICLGLVEFVWLWAYPNALLDIAALNIVAFVFLIRQHVAKQGSWTAVFRLVATNAFAAICLIQVFLPNLMQARRWAGQEADAHFLDADLLRTTLSQLFLGVEFVWPGWPESAGLPFFAGLPPGHQAICFLLLLVMCITGVITLCKASRTGSILVLAVILSCSVFAHVTRMAATYFYPRFVIAMLPCVVILAAFAFASGGRTGRPFRWGVIALGLVVAGFGFSPLIAGQIGVLVTRPIAPLHDAAAFVQGQSAKLAKPPLIVCYGLGREVMPVYEPRSIGVENAASLSNVFTQARAEQRALFVIQGYNNFNRQLLADGFKLLDDKLLFSEVAAFPGIDPEFYFRVFQMK